MIVCFFFNVVRLLKVFGEWDVFFSYWKRGRGFTKGNYWVFIYWKFVVIEIIDGCNNY